ncbi:MAG TPA: OsmC family protein [Phenylobacterium sp.]|nr:OsmC family protein [Phenylobacterium sp.]
MTYTAIATARDGASPSVAVEGADLDLALSTPPELGGRGGAGANAEQLLAAGYASCLLSALRLAALQRQLDVSGAEVRCVLDLVGRGAAFEASARLEADIPSLPEATARELLEAACAAWPYAADRGVKIPNVELAGAGEARGATPDVAARQEATDGGGYA